MHSWTATCPCSTTFARRFRRRFARGTMRTMAWSVLIVDDHEGFRAGARALLEAEGFEVLGEAADGESAVEQARRLRPPGVLLDIQLPRIDGLAVAEELAAAPAAPAG